MSDDLHLYRWEANDDCCDECETHEGYHVSHSKPETHSGCKCTIEEVDADFEEELKNFQVTQTSHEVTIHDHHDNCYNWEEVEQEVDYDFAEVEENYDHPLLQEAAEKGWEEPAQTMSDYSLTLHIPPDSTIEVTVEVETIKAGFSGEIWVSTEIEGHKISRHISDATGYWEGTTDATPHTESETCKIVIEDPL